MSAKKAPERRQNRVTKDAGTVLSIVPAKAMTMPSPEPGWCDQIVGAWNDFWSSQMAGPQIFTITDRPALKRLFDMRNRLLSALESFDAEPIVRGSTGQDTLSPWAQEVHRLESVVSKLESNFGLTPMARMKLGVRFEEGINLAQRNAQMLDAFRAAQSGRSQ